MEQKITILLLEDDNDDVLLVKERLNKTVFSDCELLVSSTLGGVSEGNILSRHITLILLDLHLRDADGVDCVRKVRAIFPDTAIIILTGLDQEEMALATLREGAQNYLDKAYLNHRDLERAILYAIERNSILLKLKQSESKFRALIEHDNDGIILINKAGELLPGPKPDTILEWTEEYIRANNKSIFPLVHPDDERVFKATYRTAMAQPVSPVSICVRLMHRLGHFIWVEGTITNMLHNPAVEAVVCNYRDITLRKNAEEQIKKLNADLENRVRERTMQLEAANKDLESFSSSVSHDLRSPLNTIYMVLQLFDEETLSGLSPEVKDNIATIDKCTLKMIGIVDALLSFSRLGYKAIEKTEIDMQGIVSNICDDIQKTSEKATDIKIQHLPHARGDHDLICQVWTNLISNAVKYSSKKERPKIEIGSEVKDSETYFYIKDNGAGFNMNDAGQLFKAFQRMHTAEEFQGTGIGLSLVQNIISKHGGRIWAEAQVNEGATFWFTLPMTAA